MIKKMITGVKERFYSWVIRIALAKKQGDQKQKLTEEQKAKVELYKRFKETAYFIEWVDKQLTSRKERKNFWGEFIDSKQVRKEYFERFLASFQIKEVN